jgi:hypothetical protein
VLKQIYSHCRCITLKTLRHRCEKDFTICIKYGTKMFIQKFQVLVSECLKWWLKLLATFHIMDLWYICVSLSQYLDFVGKLFCSTLCAYSRVFDTPVPQVFVCDASEEANLVLKRIYPHCRCITHKALRLVMCWAGLGSKAWAWAGLLWAWAYGDAEPSPVGGLGLGWAWLGLGL